MPRRRLCALALLALTAAGLAIPRPATGAFGLGYGAALDAFVAIACLQGVVYLVAVTTLRSETPPGLAFILATAALLRLMVLAFPPFLSNDMYRYIWDGAVQLAGINPYRYIPDDPHLAFLRDSAVFPHINRASYAPTIYPPAAQLFFAGADFLSRALKLPPVFGMKLAMVGVEAAGILAMLRLLDRAGLPRRRILIYAWNPLPIWEFAGNGHVDAIAVGFVALALLAAVAGRPAASAATLAGAVLAKFLPAVLLPALWRRGDRRFAIVFAAVIVLLYLPYLGVGTGVFGFLAGYGRQEGIDTGNGIMLLDLLGIFAHPPGYAAKLYLALLALLLAGIGLAILRRPPPPGAAGARLTARRCQWLGGVLLVGISAHYPWYYTWLLVPACVTASAAILYLASASFLLYLNPTHTGWLWPAIVFLPCAAIAIFEFRQPRTEGDATP